MIFLLSFPFFTLAETVNIHSLYSSTSEQLCVNFILKAIGLKLNDKIINTTFRLLTPGIQKGWTTIENNATFYFNLTECNNFNWGMSSSNDNQFVLDVNDTLRIWVDDASSYSESPNNRPSAVSRQLTSMIHTMEVLPEITIRDAMTGEICKNVSSLVYNDTEDWWELVNGCKMAYFYDFRYNELYGFFSQTGGQPLPHTNVYPPISNLIKTTQKFNEEQPPLVKAVRCPCRTPLNVIVYNEKLYISSTNLRNYTVVQNTGKSVKMADFLDNSLVYYADGKITIMNFVDSDQIYEFVAEDIDRISSPNFCSFSNFWMRGKAPSGILVWSKSKRPNEFIFVNLTDFPTKEKIVLTNENIIATEATMSSNGIFYFLVHNTSDNKFYCKMFTTANRFTEKKEIKISINAKLHWSPFGYLFIIDQGTIYVSSDTNFLFRKIDFSNSVLENIKNNIINAQINFQDIFENEKGQFLVTTSEGDIYFFTIDCPYLSLLQVKFDSQDDSITVSPDGGTFAIIDSSNNVFQIPLESETTILRTFDKFWNKTVCPDVVEIIETLPDVNIILDKRDVLKFSGSIFSQSAQSFVVRATNKVWTNISTLLEEVIQLQPQTNQFLPLQMLKFNATITPRYEGIGRIVIHTTSPSWICNIDPIVRNIAVGCPAQKELIVRNGAEIVQFYTNPYVRPIIDIYMGGEFVEEYTGNVSVESTNSLKIGFLLDGNNILNKTNGNMVFIREYDKAYSLKLSMADDSWSYCSLSTEVTVILKSPKHPYYYHSLFGAVLYILMILIFFISVCCVSKKKRKGTILKMGHQKLE